MSSAKWRPFCLGLNVLNKIYQSWRDSHDSLQIQELLNVVCAVDDLSDGSSHMPVMNPGLYKTLPMDTVVGIHFCMPCLDHIAY